MIDSQGIILKRLFQKKDSLILLDATYGKIMCTPNKENLCVGGLITYQLYKQTHSYVAQGIEYSALPCKLTKDDLLFYHLILEVCYYFIPLENFSSEAFYYIRHLPILEKHCFSYRYKNFFLARLILLLGIQEELIDDQHPLLTELFATDVDSIIIESIDLKLIDEMVEWIHKCLSSHPLRSQFKTLHFLKKEV